VKALLPPGGGSCPASSPVPLLGQLPTAAEWQGVRWAARLGARRNTQAAPVQIPPFAPLQLQAFSTEILAMFAFG